MANYIDWYLVEVERRLKRHLRPRPIHQVLTELRDHLEESQHEFEEAGQSSDEASLSAVRTFGTPEAFVADYLGKRHATTFGLPTTKLAQWLLYAAAAALPIGYLLNKIAFQGLLFQAYLASAVAVAFLFVAGRARCGFYRQILRTSGLAAAGLFLVLFATTVQDKFGGEHNRLQLQALLDRQELISKNHQAWARKYERAMVHFAAGDASAPEIAEFRYNGNYSVPQMKPKRDWNGLYPLGVESDFERARRLWAAYGKNQVRLAESEAAVVAREIEQTRALYLSGPSPSLIPSVALAAVRVAAAQCLLLLFLNWFGVRFSRFLLRRHIGKPLPV